MVVDPILWVAVPLFILVLILPFIDFNYDIYYAAAAALLNKVVGFGACLLLRIILWELYY